MVILERWKTWGRKRKWEGGNIWRADDWEISGIDKNPWNIRVRKTMFLSEINKNKPTLTHYSRIMKHLSQWENLKNNQREKTDRNEQ